MHPLWQCQLVNVSVSNECRVLIPLPQKRHRKSVTDTVLKYNCIKKKRSKMLENKKPFHDSLQLFDHEYKFRNTRRRF